MLKARSFVIYAAIAAVAVSALAAGRAQAAADRAAAEEKERQLIGVLESGQPQDKALACKQLAVYGSKASVPALAALLKDEHLASWARIALEAIPDTACDDALRQATGQVKGRLLVGVINSIGVRRDAKAVEGLVALLKDADADVASAAAVALGRIGGQSVAAALEPALASAPAAVRSAVAEGCILCGERFIAQGKLAEAAKLYDAVRKADVPKQRVLEATRGAILARQAAGVPLLVEQLRSPDKAVFAIGLSTARELPGREATDAVAAELAKAPPERQGMLLLALADRGDAQALPAVLAAAKGGPAKLRIAAMGALERLGNASCVPMLLDASLEADAELSQTAKATLIKLPGDEVDAALVARMPQTSGKMRQVVIEMAGQRRTAAALPAIMRCVEDADAGVRAAAVDAIGSMGDEKHAADLVKALQKTADQQDRAAIEKALMSICGRAKTACVAALMPVAKSGDAGLRVIAVHALACAGGPDALAAVKAAVDDKDETVQDEAVRTLSTWPNRWPDDAAAAAPLLAVAKSAKKPANQVLALRGYMQYVQGAKKVSADERLARVKEALPLVTRPEEKRLAISVLGGIAAAGSLEMLAAFAADPATAEEACSAIANLAAKPEMRSAPKELRQKALQTVVDKSKSEVTRKKAEEALKAVR